MSTTTASIRETPGRQEQLSTRIVFFIAGFGMAAWAPLVPFAKTRANIDDGMLGLLLLCLGAGSIVSMPLAGALAARFGCRLVIALSTGLICLTLPFLATVSVLPQLVACLLIFGAGVGCLDVSMNIQAVIVERASGQTMMSGFHGLFSLGGIAGAAGITLLLGAGASPLMAVLFVIAGMAAALALSASHLLPYGSKTEGPTFALPHGPVLFIGVLCFILFLTEGALLDWSAVFLTSVRGMDASQAGFGYATFALAMTTGRLTGDRVVRRVGPIRIVIFGALCAAAGVALATLISSWQVALLGYALVGLGCSNIVPVLFSSVGRQTIMAENVAIPAITTLGYAGILVGPAAIGFVSHSTNLQTAFMILALMLLGVAASGHLLRV
jgi:predicted MFS family arabinose efflux permease